MAYSIPWSIDHPGCIIFLVDQSAAMQEVFCAGSICAGVRQMDGVATVLNRWILRTGNACRAGNAVVPRVYIAVIGYSSSHSERSILPEQYDGKELVSISDLMASPLRVENHTQTVLTDLGEMQKVRIRAEIT